MAEGEEARGQACELGLRVIDPPTAPRLLSSSPPIPYPLSPHTSGALGKAQAAHDLSLVATGLRSHGGRHEQIVPLVVSHRLSPHYAARHAAGAQSRDPFDFVLNGIADSPRSAGVPRRAALTSALPDIPAK